MHIKCITVTLNPSLDRTITMQYLRVDGDNLVTEDTKLFPAGRGMNISQALNKMGVNNEAIVLLGDDLSSYTYERLINGPDFPPVHVVRRSGEIRSNVFLVDTGHNTHASLKESGGDVSQKGISDVAEMLISKIKPNDFVILAGALPKGVDDNAYGHLCNVAKEAGARVVLATSGNALEHGIKADPNLVVLNQLQLESYFNFPIRSHEGVIWCAHKLCNQGVERVLVMLDDDSGALLAADGETLFVEFPEDIDPGTYPGTYDAMIAGYLNGRLKQRPLENSLALGGAAATYTAAQVGPEFGTAAEIKEYLEDVNVAPVDKSDTP